METKSLSIEGLISIAVEKAMSAHSFVTYPVFCNKKSAAKLLGMSPATFDRLFLLNVLNFDEHTTITVDNGHRMYYMPAIIYTLAPKYSPVLIFGLDKRKES